VGISMLQRRTRDHENSHRNIPDELRLRMPEPGDSDKNLNFGFVPPSIFRESNPRVDQNFFCSRIS
jgi:hypothetical protein